MNITTPTNNVIAQTLASQSKPIKTRPAPHIVIVGASGTGKSRSIKNLPPALTKIINIENKTLPFKEASTFEATEVTPTNAIAVEAAISGAMKEPGIKYIVIDSFTKYLEMLMAESRALGGGYEIFNRYNTRIYNLLEGFKKCTDKIIIMLSIDELVKVEQASGAISNKRHVSVEGKVWFTKIEKEFAVVLFTDAQTKPQPGQPRPITSYNFVTNTDGITSAKSPEGMFEYYIPNDLAIVVKGVEDYFKL